MKSYKDIYKFPLSILGKYSSRVYDNDKKHQNFVFQFVDRFTNGDWDKEFLALRDKAMKVINSEENMNSDDNYFHDKGFIYKNDTEYPLILIRGWGNLTGIGGHNLNPEIAAKIQDTFAEFIVERLNSK